MSEQQQNAIGAAHAVKASVDALSGKVEDLSTRMGLSESDRRTLHRSNRLNRILIVLVILALLGAGSAIGYAISNGASISQIHASNLASCRATNQTRAKQVQVWVDFIALATRGNKSAAVRREADGFIGHIRKVDAPRDCAKVYRLGS